MPNSTIRNCAALVLTAVLAACATTGGPGDAATGTEVQTGSGSSLAEKVEREMQAETSPYPSTEPLPEASNEPPAQRPIIVRGDGQFINTRAASRPQAQETSEGEVTLNFELADIRDVVKVIFDTLGQNYILDPAVQGEVTVQTSRPLPKDALLPTLETLLRQVGATLVKNDGVYKIVPAAQAVSGNSSPRLGRAELGPGYNVRIFPLRYISATEMEAILKPFAPEGGVLLVDPVRNLLILAGSQRELDYLQETIDIFDVNWLKGMSVGFYPLQNVDAEDVAAELSKLFGPDSGLPFAGLFRFVPITRLNALLAITPQSEYLNEVTVWIERLDESGGERLYVYKVQNSDAEYLASLVGQIFDTKTGGSASSSTSGQVAPGLQPASISSGGGESANLASYQAQEEQPPPDSTVRLGRSAGGNSSASGRVPTGGGPTGTGGLIGESVKIIADAENNALLIWAGSQQYDKILSALRQIDVPKRQVLIEATIAEVSLTDQLQYGLQWFFKNDVGRFNGLGSLNLGNDVPVGNVIGDNFTYAISDAGGIVRALLNVLAQESKLRVLSSPQLLVLDNQEARIQVGDQVPVATSTDRGSGGDIITQNIQFKDTGVILQVKPQVNASGLVTLDLTQEVTDVGNQTVSGTNQLPFLKREINSKVAVQSGQTIVLGGLIRENKQNASGGIPGLHKLPVVGGLFGTKSNNYDRTELVVLLTPRVVQNSTEAAEVASEIKERMRGIVPLESPWKQPLQPPNQLNPQ